MVPASVLCHRAIDRLRWSFARANPSVGDMWESATAHLQSFAVGVHARPADGLRRLHRAENTARQPRRVGDAQGEEAAHPRNWTPFVLVGDWQ
jgi:hypothetical protein